MSVNNCDLYGCLRRRGTGEVTATIGEDIVVLRVCDFHRDYFQTTEPDQYSLGYAFNGQVEIRFIPFPSYWSPDDPDGGGVSPEELTTAINAHKVEVAPHKAYDIDMPSLKLIFENGLI